MKRAVLALLVLLLSRGTLLFGAECGAQIRIALYPYFHDPAAAWRVTVCADGSTRYEESAEPVKLSAVTSDTEPKWVQRRVRFLKQLPRAAHTELLERLRALGLDSLKVRYSADYTITDPSELKQITKQTGPSAQIAEVLRLVTHGATYRLQVALDDVSVDTSVYQPFVAMEYESPPHPERAAIRKTVAAWYYILEAIGPVNDFNAKMFQQGIE